MSRPSEVDALRALDALARLKDGTLLETDSPAGALRVLRAAVKPRPVWPAKEASECLGCQTAHLMKLKGLPEPAQTLDRPTVDNPDKKMYLHYVDLIEEFRDARRRVKEGGS